MIFNKQRMDIAFSTLTASQRQFLGVLALENVKYVVIGGYAIRFHGKDRPAKDLDLLVGYEPANARRILAVLTYLGKVAPIEAEKKLTKPKGQIRWYDVELLTSIDGLDFDEVFGRAVIVRHRYLQIPVADAKDALAAKKVAARPEDEEDIKFLESALHAI